MSKYDIAIFIVCSIEGFICYLIGYKIGITHEKRTNTHECVKDTHDKTEPTISKMEQVDEPMKTTDYCKKCNHKGCETCVADGRNLYCVPSRYEPKDEPQIFICPIQNDYEALIEYEPQTERSE